MRNAAWILQATNLFTKNIAHKSNPSQKPHTWNFFSSSNMAWFCSGESNEELVDNMRKGGLIESDVVAEVGRVILFALQFILIDNL